MAWVTRPHRMQPIEDVYNMCRGLRLNGKRVRLTLDPRSYEYEDANDLRVEGRVMACTHDGPTLILDERDMLDGGKFALVDILAVEVLDA